MQFVDLISRWVHIFTAIALFGGVIFQRFVLLTALNGLPDAERTATRERIVGGWKRFVHSGIALLLLSGFWNFYRALGKETLTKAYHPLLGTKILVSFAVFFLASVMVGRSAKFAAMRENPKKWLTVLVVLAAIVVALGGAAKILGYGPIAVTE